MPQTAKEPTQEEIKKMCKEIQKEWTPQQEVLRRTGLPADEIDAIRWTVPGAKFYGSKK